MKNPTLALTAGLIFALGSSACDSTPSAPDPAGPDAASSTASAESPRKSNAPFKVIRQSFDHDTGLWADAGTDDGFEGWCGDIRTVDRRSGPVEPSAGRGYALVSSGPCNAFWAVVFPPTAPYGPFQVQPPATTPWYSDRVPASGYVHDLDVYLDPTESDLSAIYLVSVRMLDDGSFRYFPVFLGTAPSGLLVNGFEVDRAGWYTLRFRFSDERGGLDVDFELRRGGRALFSHPVDATFPLQGPVEDPADFPVSNVGSGYSWFLQIASGVELPIDEQMIRPGR